MDRRRFLQSSGALVAAGVASGACSAGDPLDPHDLQQPALLAGLGPAVVRDIGRRFLETLEPSARTVAALRAAIAEDANDARPWPWSPAPTLASLVTSDFAAAVGSGRLVLPDGWVLSVTEARQCALVALASR